MDRRGQESTLTLQLAVLNHPARSVFREGTNQRSKPMAHVRTHHQNHPIPEELMGDKALNRLLARHAALEGELVEMTAGPLVDWDGVKLVKRQKLSIAEQIEAVKRQLQ